MAALPARASGGWAGGPYATIKDTHELVAEQQSEIDEGLASDNQHDNLTLVAI